MANLVDKVLRDILSDGVRLVSSTGCEPTAVDLKELLRRTEQFVAALQDVLPSMERLESDSANLLNESLMNTAPRAESDIAEFVRAAQEAEITKLDRQEFEAMAKLVNRMPCRYELESLRATLEEELATLHASVLSVEERNVQRRSVIREMQRFIPSVIESMKHDLPEHLLPPLEEVDASLFIIS